MSKLIDKIENCELISIDIIDNLFKELEKNFVDEIPSGYVNGVLIHLYLKSKRAFQIINVILNSDLPNNYLETTHHLRVILENYLHCQYIEKNFNNIPLLEEEYKKHTVYQQYKFGQNLAELNDLFKGHIYNGYHQVIEDWYEGKEKPKPIQHLNNIKELSKKVNKFQIYAEIYTVLSNNTHYSPLTKQVLGEVEGNHFVFNKYNYDPGLEFTLRGHSIGLTLGIVRVLIECFGLNDFLKQNFKPIAETWNDINDR